MIESRHHPFYVWFFDRYSEWMLKYSFRKVNIIGSLNSSEQSICLVGNHFSWWDGFIAQYLNVKLFKKKLHIMMLEDQLKHRMFLNKAGAFSIRKESREIITSLQYAAEALQKKSTILVMYPQGEIQSMYTFEFQFDRGLERIRKSSPNHTLLFYQAFVDYGSNRKPSLTIYLINPNLAFDAKTQSIQASFQMFFEQNRALQLQNIC